jgi:hypothetical protein
VNEHNPFMLSEKKKANLKDSILYDPTYLAFCKRQNFQEPHQISDWKWGERLTTKGHEETFGSVRNILYFYCVGSYMAYMSVKTQSCTSKKEWILLQIFLKCYLITYVFFKGFKQWISGLYLSQDKKDIVRKWVQAKLKY